MRLGSKRAALSSLLCLCVCSARRVVLLSAFSKWALMTKAHIISKLGPAHRTAPQVSTRRLLLLSLHRRPRPLARPDACACSLGKLKLVFGQVRLILQTLISLDSARANYYRYALGTHRTPVHTPVLRLRGWCATVRTAAALRL